MTQTLATPVAPVFAELLERYLPSLKSFLRLRAGRMVRERESLSDLAQSVCREALVHADEFEYRGDAAFRTWLHRQASHKILYRQRYWRQAMRDPRVERPTNHGDRHTCRTATADAALPTTRSASEHASAREELERIGRAVENLPSRQRDAIALCRIVGLDYAEAARQLDCTESACRGLVARGLARLSKTLPNVDG